jgi:hypothetical protein
MSKYRFSGHETFVCRYAWLPKAVQAVSENPKIFSDEDQAMVALGVGKNMVRSIRFWAEAIGVIENTPHKGFEVTPFGKSILWKNGFDPYLEDEQTLWLFHWKLSAPMADPLFAWDFLLNRWHEPEITRSSVLQMVLRLPDLVDYDLSKTTIEDHLDVFFRTYYPTRGKKGEVKEDNLDSPFTEISLEDHLDVFFRTYYPTRGKKGEVKEDNLDSPFTEISLLEKMGERHNPESGHFEPVYAFRRDEKPEISAALFAFALNDFFTMRFPDELTIPFREVAMGFGSPGQIFKLPESEIRERLEQMNLQHQDIFEFHDSTTLQQVRKKKKIPSSDFLKDIYV